MILLSVPSCRGYQFKCGFSNCHSGVQQFHPQKRVLRKHSGSGRHWKALEGSGKAMSPMNQILTCYHGGRRVCSGQLQELYCGLQASRHFQILLCPQGPAAQREDGGLCWPSISSTQTSRGWFLEWNSAASYQHQWHLWDDFSGRAREAEKQSSGRKLSASSKEAQDSFQRWSRTHRKALSAWLAVKTS